MDLSAYRIVRTIPPTMTSSERKRKASQYQPLGCWIRPVKRLSIYIRDSFQCCYCNVSLKCAAPSDITLDHLIPVSKMGSNESTNLITSCRACNSARGNKALDTDTMSRCLLQAAQSLNIALAKAILSGDSVWVE